MTHQEIIKNSNTICQLLIQHQLKDAFDALQKTIGDNALGQFIAPLENLQTTYKYMLQYTVQNIQDSERQKIYKQLVVSLFNLTDKTEQHLLEQHSTQMPYAILRTQPTNNFKAAIKNLIQVSKQLEMVELGEQHTIPFDIKHSYQMHLSEVFMVLWSTHFYTEEHVTNIKELCHNGELKEYELSLLTSAISLSLWRNFDVQKFNALFELTNHASELVKQRAFVGLLISVYIYNERLRYFTSVSSRFSLLAENKYFKKSLEQIIIQFIKSKESEKIARKFQEEIIPEMVKITPIIREKLDIDKLEGEKDLDDKNPDWQEMLDEVPGLTDKMKEISELQMEGADVFLSTFSMLKSFPFFNPIYNWLVPFTTSYPDLSDQLQTENIQSFAKAIEKSLFLCNSDKYSFILSMEQLPESQRKTMSAAVGADFENMKDIEKSENEPHKNRQAEFISNQYVQDLYRFFNLHPQKSQFDNPFQHRLDFHNKNIIANVIEDQKIWRNVAEYYFAKNYFTEAGELFELLLQDDSANVECLQKRGYCAQKTNDHKLALDYYMKADLVESSSVWTLKKIAYCYQALGKTKKALENYQLAANLQPQNINLQYAIANCFLSLKNYNEALNNYFKIELNTKNKKKAWRPIAWCSFVAKKPEQAKKYYEKLMDQQASGHDYINAGHVALVSHEYETAVDYYKKAIHSFKGDINKMMTIFEEDKPFILNYDIDTEDLPIILDKLRYEL